MSLHIHSTVHEGQQACIQLGWDRALNFFFLDVHKSGADPSQPLYTSASEDDPRNLDLDHFVDVLTRLNLTVPKSMFNHVVIDAMSNAGNRIARHAFDGTIREEGEPPNDVARELMELLQIRA